MPDPLTISASSLLAFQRALSTVSHNIANASTEGYSRQRVELATRPPQRLGNGFVGQGVVVNDTVRIQDRFLNLRLQQSISETHRLDTFHTLASQVDNLLGENQAGLSSVLQEFFNGVQAVANDPSALPSRTVMLASADSMIERFRFLGQQLDAQSGNINIRLNEMVNSVNSLAQGIASVNQDIVLANSQGGGHAPNDLLDRRDQLVNRLSEYLNVTTVEEQDGSINVFVGNGQSLVVGSNARSLVTAQDPENFAQLQIAYQTSNGTLPLGNQLSGGSIGGILAFRDNVLTPARNELGRIAIVLADSFNTQHRAGMTLNDNLGTDFFNVPTPLAINNQNNTGSAAVTVSINDSSALTASDYRLRYDGPNYTLTRLSDNTVVTGPGPFNIDGLDISISAGASAGDSFLIRPTYHAANTIALQISDARDIAAAAPIRTSALPGNISDATINPGRVLDATDPDLLDTVEIVFNDPPTTFDIVNITDASTIAAGVAYSSGAAISFNGVEVSVNGSVNAGDRFRIERNTGAVTDNRNALLLGSLQAQGLIGGNATYQQGFAALVGRVGAQTHQAQLSGEAQQSLLTQAREARDSVSGVNLDEEAVNLLRFQQAYQAATQVITASNEMFQTLLAAVQS